MPISDRRSEHRFWPYRFRAFLRWYEKYFVVFILVLWFGGIGAMLFVSLFNLDQKFHLSVNRVALFTIWPALIGWLAVSGVGILWKLGLLSGQIKSSSHLGRVLYSIWLLAGVLFLAGAAWLLLVVARGANGA